MDKRSSRDMGRKLVAGICAYVANCLAPLISQMQELHARLDRVVTLDEVRQEIAKARATREAPLTLETRREDIEALVSRVELGVESRLQGRLEAAVSRYEALMSERFSDRLALLETKIPVPRDGRDGASLEDLDIEELDGGRRLLVKVTFGGQTYVKEIRTAMLIDRGVYSSGMQALRGDAVTFNGSLWVALEDTEARPGESHHWRLMVRKGRDGKDGKDGKSYGTPDA